MTEATNKPPVHKLRKDNISTAIWQHTSKDGNIFHTIEISHSFKERDGSRQTKKISLLPHEALVASNILEKSFMDYYTLPQFDKNNESA